ncbi:MAG: peptide chain release factor aRF-1 [archaeon]|nr:peptide chain release factor aRF-1 [archaeon]
MTTDSVKQYKMRKDIASLSSKEGTAKDLVSIYIPRGKSIEDIDIVLKEKLDSREIKSQGATQNVQDELAEIIHHLKTRNGIPDNGLAIFAAVNLGAKGVEIRELIPPEPVTEFIFVVDNHFNLEPLRTMLREDRVVGIISMDANEAGFGILNGERLDVVDHITSGISGKTDKGGWSQRRYERERDMELTYYFHRVAEHATDAFITIQKVTGLIVGGPGLTKEDFLKEDFLRYELKNMLLSRVDTSFSGKEGVKEAFDKSADALKNIHSSQDTKLMQRLEADIAKKDGLAVSGLHNVLDVLRKGIADVVLVANNTGLIEIVLTCKKCDAPRRRLVHEEKKMETTQRELLVRCEKCNGLEYEVEDRDIVDALEDVASATDAKVEVISSEGEEKEKLNSLGGFAALLRYRVA